MLKTKREQTGLLHQLLLKVTPKIVQGMMPDRAKQPINLKPIRNRAALIRSRAAGSTDILLQPASTCPT